MATSTRPKPVNPERRYGPALEAMYRFIVWLVPTLEKFPRSRKYLLPDRIEAQALDCLSVGAIVLWFAF